MSRNQRIGLLVAAAMVAAVAIAVAVASGGDDDGGGQATGTETQTVVQEQTATSGEDGAPTETTSAPAEPTVNRIRIQDGQVVGGPGDIKVKKGDQVTIVVSADAPDDVHLHGYDIEKSVGPGQPATFEFTADIEGIFEMESHRAEDEGRDPLLATLTVEPS